MTESPSVNQSSAESSNTNYLDSPSAGFENISSTTDSFVDLNSERSSPTLSSSSTTATTINGQPQQEELTNMSTENDSSTTSTSTAPATSGDSSSSDNKPTSSSQHKPSDENNEYANLTTEERIKINNEMKEVIRKAPLIVGESWFLINYEWYDKWSKNNFGPEELGPIDNTNILVPGTEFLKPGQVENNHFAVVPSKVWDYFLKSYGCNPVVSRKVTKLYMSTSIDYNFPVPLKVFKSSQPSKVFDVFASKSETVNKFKERVCKTLEVEPNNVRIWDYYNNSKYNELKNPEYISNCRLIDGQQVLFDERLADGNWPQEKTQSSYGYSRYSQRSGPPRPGISGLDNLGNTCFMNSSLQCLSNAIPLTRYLLNEKHLEHLNVDNPLGCGGDLAKEYANLIKQIWRGDMTSVGPRTFKSQIERFAPQFMGYQQHDSQELLAFLLDGLHEDMNQVKKKPFFEGKDYDGRPDEIIAKEQWDMHKARNKSIIVDWFQAQLKSKLVCPVCANISITFDPFMYLSLPLPVNVRKVMSIVYVPYDGNVLPTLHNIELNKNSPVQELLDLLSANVRIPSSKLLATLQNHNQIHKYLKPTSTLDGIGNRDPVVVYEIKDTNTSGEYVEPSERTIIKVTMKTNSYQSHFPFILSVALNELTCIEELYSHIINRLGDLLKERERIQDIFENNEKPVEQETPAEDEEDSYTRYNHYHRMQQKPKDPRFIFQMTVDNKESIMSPPKPFSFEPINFDSITLHWESQNFERYFDSERLEGISQMTFHRDIASEKEIDLKTCIELFTSTEKLGAEDPWYCSKCKVHQQATKKFDIWSAPPILVIHLKRFSYKRAWREKLDTLVRFPIKDLDLSPYVLSPEAAPMYDLFAVSNHYGSMGGGHYTAYALNELENQWVKFDDSSTHNVDPSNVVTDAAYVLFYRRKDTYDPEFHLNVGLKEVKDITSEMNANNSNNNSESNGTSSPNGYESSGSSSAWTGNGLTGGSGYSGYSGISGYSGGRSSAIGSSSATTSSNFVTSRAQASTTSTTSTTRAAQAATPTNSNDTGSADAESTEQIEQLSPSTDQPLMQVD